jgi:hypothetical protein
MRGLDPRIHHLQEKLLRMDCRVKPGNDEEKVTGKADGRVYIFVIGSSFSPERNARSGAVSL